MGDTNTNTNTNNWWGPLIQAAAQYYMADQANDRRDRDAIQNSRIDVRTGTTMPSHLQDLFDYGLGETLNLYQQSPRTYNVPRPRQVGAGISENTNVLMDELNRWALNSDPNMAAASDWMTGLFSGGGAPNEWMSAAFDNAQSGTINDYIAMAMQGMGGGLGGVAGGGAGGGGFRISAPSVGAGPGRGETMLLDFADPILQDPTGNPLYSQLAALGERRATEAYNQAYANAVGNAAAAGRMGSGAYNALQGANAGQLGQGIADANTMAAMQLLGLGVDAAGTGGGLETSRLNTNTGAQASLAGAAMSANASLAAQRAALDNQFRLGMAGLGLDALGLQQNAMSGLGNDWLNAQIASAQLLPEYHDTELQDLLAAFEAQSGLDRQRQQAAMHNANAMNRWAQNRFNFESERPWDLLSNYGQMLGVFGSPFMEQYETGQVPGGYQGLGAYRDPYGAALGGLFGGLASQQNQQNRGA